MTSLEMSVAMLDIFWVAWAIFSSAAFWVLRHANALTDQRLKGLVALGLSAGECGQTSLPDLLG